MKADKDARFAFGENWRSYSASLQPEQIQSAHADMVRLLKLSDITGMTFLDVGSGSGIMSLVAHKMGARVVAFDYDPIAVATSISIRDREAEPTAYTVTQGSIIDKTFTCKLEPADIVYCWGVLHHTGNMWVACENVVNLVAPGGLLALAIYNDQGFKSRLWRRIKRTYVSSSVRKRRVLVGVVNAYFEGRHALAAATRFARTRRTQPGRGMDRHHDLVDWVGGYPFEVAKPEDVFGFFHSRGFTLESLTTCAGGPGCNEFLFRRQ